MPNREIARSTDRVQFDQSVDSDESVFAKIAREAYVIGAGTLKGMKDGAVDALDDMTGTSVRAGLCAGIGLVLGITQRSAGLLRLGGQALAVGLGLSFYRDVASPARMGDLSDALSASWASGANTDMSIKVVGDRVGRMAFDALLFSGAAYGGARIGQKYLSIDPHARLTEPSYMSSYDRYLMEKMNRPHDWH